MITKLRKRIESEKGFTLIEMLIVIIILGILIAIAVPAYLKFRDNANEGAAQANIRAAIPAIENYNAENTGVLGDADNSAATSGYDGMTVALLQGIDPALKGSPDFTVVSKSTGAYCVSAKSSTKVAYKSSTTEVYLVPPGTACT